jgi:tetratricopeptide (TPR) repeat protein
VLKQRYKIFLALISLLISPGRPVFADSVSSAFGGIAAPDSVAMGDSVFFPESAPGSMLANPALTALSFHPQVSFYRAFFPQANAYNFGAMSFLTGAGNFSLAYGGNEIYNSATLNYSAVLYKQVPIAYELMELGINVNYNRLNEGSPASASGVSADIGLVAPLGLDGNLKLGGVYKNIGGALRSAASKDDSLGSSVNLGLLYKLPLLWDLNITAGGASDLIADRVSYSAAASINPVYPLVLRAGWKEAENTQVGGFRGGVDLAFSYFSISYAIAPFDSSSLIHRLGIDIPFGSITKPSIAYDYYLKFYFDRAVSYFNKGDLLAAKNEFSSILVVYSDNEPSKKYLRLINEKLGQVEEQKAARVNELLRRAQVAVSKNDFIKASEYLDAVIVVDPNNSQAQELYKQIGGVVKSVMQGKTIEANRKNVKYLWDDAQKNYERGNYVRAKEDFDKILDIDPDNVSVKRNLKTIEEKLSKVTSMQVNELYLSGLDLYSKGEYAKAQKYFESVVLADPKRLDAKEYISKCIAAQQGKAAQPGPVSNPVPSRLSGNSVVMKYSQAMDLIKSGDYEDALGQLDDALKIARESGNSNYEAEIEKNIVLCKKKLADRYFAEASAMPQNSQIEDVVARYKKALVLDPDNEMIKKAYEESALKLAQKYYEDGMAFVEQGNNPKAKELFRKSLTYDPKKVEALRALERIQ